MERAAQILLRIAARWSRDPKIAQEARRLSPEGTVEPVFDRAKTFVAPPSSRHPTNRETVETLARPPDTLGENLIDSDDVAVWLASHVRALGYEVRMVLLAQDGRPFFHHVYVEAKLPWGIRQDRWVALDPFHAGPLGSVYTGRTQVVEMPKD